MKFGSVAALLLVCGLAAGPARQAHALPAFPEARGFGTTTAAGSGRHLSPPRTTVFKVTSLADSGSGTLRACVDATVPRVCVFERSGRIQLKSELRVRSPYLTIAGQTAPAPGVMITGAPLRIEDHDVLVQHLEVRPGDGPGSDPGTRDGISVGTSSASRRAYNVVLDHLSISWAIDGNLDTWYRTTQDVTISNLIVSEGLENSIHPEGGHSKGVMLGEFTTSVTMHSSLLAHNWDRNGYWKPGTTGEFLSNVIYNWGGTSGSNITNLSDSSSIGAPVLLNFAGNVYRRGPNSSSRAPLNGKPVHPATRVFVQGNIGPTRTSDNLPEWLISNMPESPHRVLGPAVPFTGAPLRSPAQTLDYVLANAGSRPAERNDVDRRTISEVRSSGGSIKDCVSGCSRAAGGWPQRAENVRAWAMPLDPFGDADRDGYTNLEERLQQLAAVVEGRVSSPAPSPAPVPAPQSQLPSPPPPQLVTPPSPVPPPVLSPVAPPDLKAKPRKQVKKIKKKKKKKRHARRKSATRMSHPPSNRV